MPEAFRPIKRIRVRCQPQALCSVLRVDLKDHLRLHSSSVPYGNGSGALAIDGGAKMTQVLCASGSPGHLEARKCLYHSYPCTSHHQINNNCFESFAVSPPAGGAFTVPHLKLDASWRASAEVLCAAHGSAEPDGRHPRPGVHRAAEARLREGSRRGTGTVRHRRFQKRFGDRAKDQEAG